MNAGKYEACIRRNATVFLLVIVFIGMLGIRADSNTSWVIRAHSEIQAIKSNVYRLLGLGGHFDTLEKELMQSKRQMLRPLFSRELGGASVGYFGYLPAIMLYNDFSYRTAPVPISFAVWNEGLMRANRRFYMEADSAPEFLLVSIATIDNRLAAQDDALSQLEIMHRYRPVAQDRGNLLLRRTPGKVDDLAWKSLLDGKAYLLGQRVQVPQVNDPLWVRIKLNKSMASSLVSLAYKPESYVIVLNYDNGVTIRRKFMPAMAEVGFMINPLVQDNASMLSALPSGGESSVAGNSGTFPMVDSFSIECGALNALCSRTLDVSFSTIGNLKLGERRGNSTAITAH